MPRAGRGTENRASTNPPNQPTQNVNQRPKPNARWVVMKVKDPCADFAPAHQAGDVVMGQRMEEGTMRRFTAQTPNEPKAQNANAVQRHNR